MSISSYHFAAFGLCLLLSACGAETPRVHVGNLQIATSVDVDAAQNLGEVTGSLRISGPQLGYFSLPSLHAVGGDVWVWQNEALKRFGLSGLEMVGGDLLVRGNSELVAFDLTALRTVVGNLSIVMNPKLPDCRVATLIGPPTILAVGGEISRDGNASHGVCDY